MTTTPEVRLYNTMTQHVQTLETLEPGHVKLYVCGPTVYDDAHLGHARCYLTWDFLVRALKAFGYTVTYVRNVTDVDDKILMKAQRNGLTMQEISQTFYASFLEDMAALNLLPPTSEPKATDHIDTMISAADDLIKKGLAYPCKDGTVYFRTTKYAPYGHLSKRSLKDMMSGARVDVDSQKENPLDFALWKGVKSGVSWKSPWGNGRPGWHIECSCMIKDVLGDQIDIHAGGADLMFPHHENEIAQSEAWLGKKPMASHWMHNGFVNVSGEKMSKSLGNFTSIRALLGQYHVDSIRYFVATHHYRMPVDFHGEALQAAQNWIIKTHRTFQEANSRVAHEVDSISLYGHNDTIADREERPELEAFTDALLDDLNTPKALAELNEHLSILRKAMASADSTVDVLATRFQTVLVMWRILGFGDAWRHQSEAAMVDVDMVWLNEQIEARRQAKADKQWTAADSIRKALAERGIQLKDMKDGSTTWTVQPLTAGASSR